MILTPLQKLPNNVDDLGKIIVATNFEWLPKVQKIANSGHTVRGFMDSQLIRRYTRSENTHRWGRITVRLVSSLTRLELTNEGNIILFVFSVAV